MLRPLLAIAAILTGIAAPVTGAYYAYLWAYGKSNHLVLTGTIASSDGTSYLNDRLVVVFRNGQEIARTVTEFLPNETGLQTDGGFRVDVHLPYQAESAEISPETKARPVSWSWGKNRHSLGELSETRREYNLSLPRRKEQISVRFLRGPWKTLPTSVQTRGSLAIVDGLLVVNENRSPSLEILDGRFEVDPTSAGEEKIHLYRRDFPIDNCQHSNKLVHPITLAHSYPHETEVQNEHTIGLEVPILKLLSIEHKFTDSVKQRSKAIEFFSEVHPVELRAGQKATATADVFETWHKAVLMSKQEQKRVPVRVKLGIRVEWKTIDGACQ